MAHEESLKTISRLASADLSTKQYRGVYLNSSGQIVVAAEGTQCIGILQDNPAAQGRAGSIGITGVSKVVAGGTVTAGSRFSFDLNGAAVAVGSGDDWSAGVALETFTAGGIYSAIIQIVGPERSALP